MKNKKKQEGEDLISMFNLPNYIKGKSFANASKLISKRFEDRTDPEAVETQRELQGRLREAQEYLKEKKAAEEQAQQPQQPQQEMGMPQGMPMGQPEGADMGMPAPQGQPMMPPQQGMGGAEQLLSQGQNMMNTGGSIMGDPNSMDRDMEQERIRQERLKAMKGMSPIAAKASGLAEMPDADLSINTELAATTPEGIDVKAKTPPKKGGGLEAGIAKYGGAAMSGLEMAQTAFGDPGIETNGSAPPPEPMSGLEKGTAVAGGALKGVKAGAAFGPVGMAVGGLLGGVASIFGNKKKEKARKEAERNYGFAQRNDYEGNVVAKGGKLDEFISGAGDRLGELARYAPIASNLNQLSTMPGPEQLNLERMVNTYKPVKSDEQAMINAVQEQAAASRNAILNSSQGSGSTARANLLASQGITQKAVSGAVQKAQLENRGEERRKQAYEQKVNQANASIAQKEEMLNAQSRAGYQTNKSGLMSDLAENIGAMGKEKYLSDMVEKMGMCYDKDGNYICGDDEDTTGATTTSEASNKNLEEIKPDSLTQAEIDSLYDNYDQSVDPGMTKQDVINREAERVKLAKTSTKGKSKEEIAKIKAAKEGGLKARKITGVTEDGEYMFEEEFDKPARNLTQRGDLRMDLEKIYLEREAQARLKQKQKKEAEAAQQQKEKEDGLFSNSSDEVSTTGPDFSPLLPPENNTTENTPVDNEVAIDPVAPAEENLKTVQDSIVSNTVEDPSSSIPGSNKSKAEGVIASIQKDKSNSSVFTDTVVDKDTPDNYYESATIEERIKAIKDGKLETPFGILGERIKELLGIGENPKQSDLKKSTDQVIDEVVKNSKTKKDSLERAVEVGSVVDTIINSPDVTPVVKDSLVVKKGEADGGAVNSTINDKSNDSVPSDKPVNPITINEKVVSELPEDVLNQIKDKEAKNNAARQNVKESFEDLEIAADKKNYMSGIIGGKKMNPVDFAIQYLGMHERNPMHQEAIANVFNYSLSRGFEKGFMGKKGNVKWMDKGEWNKVALDEWAWCATFMYYTFGETGHKSELDKHFNSPDGLRDGDKGTREMAYNRTRAHYFNNFGEDVKGKRSDEDTFANSKSGDIIVTTNMSGGNHHVGMYVGKNSKGEHVYFAGNENNKAQFAVFDSSFQRLKAMRRATGVADMQVTMEEIENSPFMRKKRKKKSKKTTTR